MPHSRRLALCARYLICLSLTGLLAGCLSQTREQLQQCTAAAAISFPEGKPMPMGQPYKDILACMQAAGYEIDYQGPCKYSDYTSNVGNASCYRPTGAIKGYIHDVVTTLR